MTEFRKILAIDTGSKAQAIALVDGESVVSRRYTVVRSNHSATLLRNIDDMLKQAGWERNAIDLLACGLGPGTFTGLRVGLAAAKAIAASLDRPIVGISSLRAIARPVAGLFDGPIVALTDARRGEVYCGIYGGPNSLPILDDCALTPDVLRERLLALGEPCALVGAGLQAHRELAGGWPEGFRVLSPAWNGPSAPSIAFLGRERALQPGPDDLVSLEPNYVRPSDAELNFGPTDARSSVQTV